MVLQRMFACAAALLAATSPAGAAASLDKTLRVHLDAITGRALETLLATVADDVVLILPNGKLVDGKQAFADFHRQWFAEPTWKMAFQEVRRAHTRDMALVLVRTDYRDQAADGSAIHTQSYLVLVFQRRGGRWLLVHDQNTRSPPEP